VRERLGGRHAAEAVLFSFDQASVIELEFAQRWEEVGEQLARAGLALAAAGCEALLVCCNSVHHEVAFEALRRAVPRVPVLHIADATAAALSGKRRVALLGTAFTANENSFFAQRLRRRGLEIVLDEPAARAELDRLIYDELTVDVVREEAARWFAASGSRAAGRAPRRGRVTPTPPRHVPP